MVRRRTSLATARRNLSFQPSVAAEPIRNSAALSQLTYTIHFTLAFSTTHSSGPVPEVAQIYQAAQRAVSRQYPIPTKSIHLVILPHRHAVNEFIEAWNQVVGSHRYPGQGTDSCTRLPANGMNSTSTQLITPIALEVIPPISSQSLRAQLTSFLKQHCQISYSAIRSGEGDVSVWLLSEEATDQSGDEAVTRARSLREILKGLDKLAGLLSGHVLKVLSLPQGGSLGYYGPLMGPHGEQLDLHVWLQGGYTVNTLKTQWKVLQRLVDQAVVSHPAFYSSHGWQDWLDELSRTIRDTSVPFADRMVWAQTLHQTTRACPSLALTYIPSLIQCQAFESIFGLTPMELLETWWQGWLHKFSRTSSNLGKESQRPYEDLAQVVSLLALLIRRNITKMVWFIWELYQTVTASEPNHLVGYVEHLLKQAQPPPIDQCQELVTVIHLLGDKHPRLYPALEWCLVDQLVSKYAHPEQHSSSSVHQRVDTLYGWLSLLPSCSLTAPLIKAIRTLLGQQQYLRVFQLLWESSRRLSPTHRPRELSRAVSKILHDDPANQWVCQTIHQLRDDWHKNHGPTTPDQELFVSTDTGDTVYGALVILQLKDPSSFVQQLRSFSAVAPWSEPHLVHTLYHITRWVWLRCLRRSRRDSSGTLSNQVSSALWPSEFGSDSHLGRLGWLQLVLYDYHRFPTLRGCPVAISDPTALAEAPRDSARALVFFPIKKEWRHLLSRKRRVQDSPLAGESIVPHVSWTDYRRFYAQSIAPVDYCQRLADEICLYAFTNETKALWAAYSTMHRWRQSQVKTGKQITCDTNKSQVTFKIDTQFIRPVYQVLLTLIRYQKLPLRYKKKILQDFTTYLAVTTDLRRDWLTWAGARLDQIILMGLLAKLRLPGILDPTIVALANQELSAQGSISLVRCLGITDTAPTAPMDSKVSPVRLSEAQALVDSLLSHPTGIRLIYFWVTLLWARMYDRSTQLFEIVTRRNFNMHTSHFYPGRVFIHNRAIDIKRPLGFQEMVAVATLLPELGSNEHHPWFMYFLAYLAVQRTVYPLLHNNPTTKTALTEPGAVTCTVSRKSPVIHQRTITNWVCGILGTPPVRSSALQLPRGLYRAIQVFYLWPVNRGSTQLTSLVVLTLRQLGIPLTADLTADETKTPLPPRLSVVEIGSVIKALAVDQRMAECRLLYQLMLDAGLPCTLPTLITFLRGYAEIDDKAGIDWTFEQLQEYNFPPNPHVYTTLITYALKNNEPEAAFNYYQDLMDAGLTPHAITFRQILMATALLPQADTLWKRLRNILEDLLRYERKQSIMPFTDPSGVTDPTAVITDYQLASLPGKTSLSNYYHTYLEPAVHYERQPLRNVFDVHVFNTMLRKVIDQGHRPVVESLVQVFLRGETPDALLRRFRITPNDRTLTLLVKFNLSTGQLQPLRGLLNHTCLESDGDYPPAVYNALFYHQVTHNDLSAAWKTWKTFVTKYLGNFDSPRALPSSLIERFGLGQDPRLVTEYHIANFLLYYGSQKQGPSNLRQFIDLVFYFEGWSPLSAVARTDLASVFPELGSSYWYSFDLCVFPSSTDRQLPEIVGEYTLSTLPSLPREWTWTSFVRCVHARSVTVPQSLDVEMIDTPHTPENQRRVVPTTATLPPQWLQVYYDLLDRWNTYTEGSSFVIPNLATVKMANRFNPRATHPRLPDAPHLPSGPRYVSIFFYTLAIHIYLNRSQHSSQTEHVRSTTTSSPSGSLTQEATKSSSTSHTISNGLSEFFQQLPRLVKHDHGTASASTSDSLSLDDPWPHIFSATSLPPLDERLLRPLRPFLLLRPDLDPDPHRAMALTLLCHLLQNVYLPDASSPDPVTGHFTKTIILVVGQHPFIALIKAYSQCQDYERVNRLYRLMQLFFPTA
ncbi:hypothetical protein IWQ61_003332 [Dispira simplex]|nr:hypothetical protein IWQ61_003332 [Dispira simplex]